MVSYKGKEVVRDDSLGKRKRGGGGNAGRGRKRKNRGVIQFVEDAAYEIDEDEASDESDFGDDFLVEEFKTQVKVKTEPGKDHHLPFVPKEEELSEEELEKMLEERYKPGSSFVKYAEDTFESKRSMEGDVVMPSTKDPTIWKVKCTVGRERQSVFCLMQKFVDLHTLGTKLQMISAFTFEHVKGYIYIEAERKFDVNEACKGLCTIYSSRVSPVPMNEVSHLLSVRSKYNEPSMGKWARVKNGKYKGDLAQVIAVNDARKKATVKLIPRIDLQAMAEKYGGGIAPKRTATPAPRLIRSTELDEFRPLIQYRRDRDAGLVFEVLDGHQLNDGYLYKKVSIDSLSFWGVVPSEEELLKFEPSKKEESDCQEWLTQLYGEPKKKRVIKSDKGDGKGEGSSSSSMATGFELHDLVFFGRTNFGVIVGTEKDEYFKILKEGSEGPVVVTVDVQQLKHASFDKKFSALDHRTKTISINDTVKVLEGPLEGRQGIVKQIFRGIVFLYDENEQENSGYFCCKAQICEKIKFSDDACKGKGGESGAVGFEDFPSSPKSPLSPKKAWQGRESGSNFNREDKDGMFSIGQSLRIRVGPLKGYLCRVLALRRSDVTVKLDSQQKILTVKSEHLAEVRGKSSAVSLGDDAESVKPFDLLGTEDSSRDWMSGAATSAEGDRWGAGGLSTERSSWPAFPSSGFSLQPESNFTNPLSSVDNDTNKDAGDAAWEIKATPNQNSSWGAVPDAKGEDTWNKPTANAGSGSIASDSWGRAKITSEDQANDASSVWGKKNDGSSDAAPSWGKKNDASSVGGWGNAEPKNQTGGWGNAGGNSSQSEAEASGWKKATTVAGGQTESWGAVKKDSASGWGKSMDSQERSAAGTEEGSWGKAAEKWGGKDDSSGSKAAWNGSTSAPESQTGGWGNTGESSWKKPDGGSSWKKQDGGSSWGNQAGGSSWTKQNDVNTGDESKGWGKPSGGDQGFGGWNKDGMGNDDDTKPFDGGRGSGGRRGGRGGSQGGRNACYKCGETGHMARECSQGGGGGGGRYGGSGGGNACFKCGETGHMARDCSQGGGGGGNACFKCGETGHMARDCSKGGGNACFKCGETGHMARDCSQGGGSGGGNACFKCGETGHMARDCSQGGGNACFKCGETGHMSRDCSQGGSSGSKAAWGGSAAESKTSTGGWGSGGWSSAQLETKTSGWKATSMDGDKTESWGAVRKDGATGWGKSMDPQERSGSKAPWGSSVAEPKDKTEGWGSVVGSSGNKAPWGGSMGSAGGSSASKASWGGSVAEPKDQTGGWGNSGGSSGSKASWGSSMAEPKDQTGGWGSAGGSSGSKAPWGSSMAESKDIEPKDHTGGWGSGAVASVAQSKVEASSWKKANSADGGQTESWGTVKKDGAASWGGSMAENRDKTAGWGSAGGSAAPSEAVASGWKKATSKSGGETESWGAAKKDGAAGWGKSMDSQEGSGGKVTEEGSWGKTAEKSSTKAVWSSSTSAPESQTGGWGNAGESSWKKPDGGSSWGNQAGGSSWTKQSDVNTSDESKGWGKPSGGERGFGGWNKDGMGNEDDTKSFDGGRGSGGRRGGRGGSQGGRNACFKCGETGHMARECSQGGGGGGRFGGGGGSGGGNACFKCGETGHMARDCSQGGGGSNACFKCGETGHMARECSQGGGGGGGRYGSGSGGGCYKCGEQGHFARECPNA